MGVATFAQAGDPIPLGGSNKLYYGLITMSTSYATGGDTLDFPGDWALTPDARVMLSNHSLYALEYDGTNGKLKAGRQKDPGNAGGADIAFTEVAAAVNLSTVVVECWVLLPG